METNALVIMISDIRPHPTQQNLEIIPINDLQVVVPKAQFKINEVVVFCKAPALLPLDNSLFSCLFNEYETMTKKGKPYLKLQPVQRYGEVSHGILLPTCASIYKHLCLFYTLGFYQNKEYFEILIDTGTDLQYTLNILVLDSVQGINDTPAISFVYRCLNWLKALIHR